MLKRFKPDFEGEGPNSFADARAATVEDEDDDTPPFVSRTSEAPHDEPDEVDEDDEDGRFFGGGLNEEQSVRLLEIPKLTI